VARDDPRRGLGTGGDGPAGGPPRPGGVLRRWQQTLYEDDWARIHWPEARLAVARAAGFVTETSSRIFGDDIQNHGGQEFTWEHDAHIYLKQAKVLESCLGAPRAHRERAASLWEA